MQKFGGRTTSLIVLGLFLTMACAPNAFAGKSKNNTSEQQYGYLTYQQALLNARRIQQEQAAQQQAQQQSQSTTVHH